MYIYLIPTPPPSHQIIAQRLFVLRNTYNKLSPLKLLSTLMCFKASPYDRKNNFILSF